MLVNKATKQIHFWKVREVRHFQKVAWQKQSVIEDGINASESLKSENYLLATVWRNPQECHILTTSLGTAAQLAFESNIYSASHMAENQYL